MVFLVVWFGCSLSWRPEWVTDRDSDNDGFLDESYGGLDCDDDDASIYPNSNDEPKDGIDQDCDGVDNLDADNDGYNDESYGGLDCDDSDPFIHPDAEYCNSDGVIENCMSGYAVREFCYPYGLVEDVFVEGVYTSVMVDVDNASVGSYSPGQGDFDCDGVDDINLGFGTSSKSAGILSLLSSDFELWPPLQNVVDIVSSTNSDARIGFVRSEMDSSWDGLVPVTFSNFSNSYCDGLVLGAPQYGEEQGAVYLFQGPMVDYPSVEDADNILVGDFGYSIGASVSSFYGGFSVTSPKDGEPVVYILPTTSVELIDTEADVSDVATTTIMMGAEYSLGDGLAMVTGNADFTGDGVVDYLFSVDANKSNVIVGVDGPFGDGELYLSDIDSIRVGNGASPTIGLISKTGNFFNTGYLDMVIADKSRGLICVRSGGFRMDSGYIKSKKIYSSDFEGFCDVIFVLDSNDGDCDVDCGFREMETPSVFDTEQSDLMIGHLSFNDTYSIHLIPGESVYELMASQKVEISSSTIQDFEASLFLVGQEGEDFQSDVLSVGDVNVDGFDDFVLMSPSSGNYYLITGNLW